MTALPKTYAWLAAEPGPRTLVEALKLFGTAEVLGAKNSPVIMAWAKEVGLASSYSADSVPWCGLFAAVVTHRAGYEPVTNPLWARNWTNFGVKSDRAALGDILVFVRDGGGHVTFYVGEDATAYHCLGGNQSDNVTITRILKSRCIGVRRAPFKVGQPANVRPIMLASTGKVSTNEA